MVGGGDEEKPAAGALLCAGGKERGEGRQDAQGLYLAQGQISNQSSILLIHQST